jgi:glycosyltransferase A (GT-A) superfamily protein (DUF2064 family)
MTDRLRSLVVIAKEPLAGRVKTRLIGDFTAEQAADLARAALLDTLAVVGDTPAASHVLLLDGRAGDWVPPNWRVIAQSAGGLDERIVNGFEALDPGPALLVGMDTPQLRRSDLAFDFARYESCLGRAADGGYWSLGFRDPRRARETVTGVPMSEAATGAIQYQRLRAAGLSVQLLDTLTDVDTSDDARMVAHQDPGTRFARQWLHCTSHDRRGRVG